MIGSVEFAVKRGRCRVISMRTMIEYIRKAYVSSEGYAYTSYSCPLCGTLIDTSDMGSWVEAPRCYKCWSPLNEQEMIAQREEALFNTFDRAYYYG